jgi:hypothetical protein
MSKRHCPTGHGPGGLDAISDAIPSALARLRDCVLEDQRRTRAESIRPIKRGSFQAAKESWLKAIASYPNLSGSDCAIAMALSTYLNFKTYEAWPSIERLAEDTNRNRATVWRSIERLEKLQLLHVERGRGRHKSNRYRPLMGSLDCNPKTLRRRDNNSANWQRKHCELAERTLEEP